MVDALNIVLFDEKVGVEEDFLVPFSNIPGVDIVAQLSDRVDLYEWARHGQVDVVAVRLWGEDESEFEVVERITQIAPRCGIIGVSECNKPQFIVGAMRAGCAQFVFCPIDQQDLATAVEKIGAKLPTASINESKRICVIGSSGGTGATTIACNLAIELAQLTQQRSGLVDMNLEFGDVACAFDCTPTHTIADVCTEGADADRTVLERALHELPCNVSLLPRPNDVSEARLVSPDGVQQVMEIMREMFPYVVVDLPRAYSYLSSAALSRADLILIVAQLGVPFIRNATRIFQCLTEMGAEADTIQIVLNRCKASYEKITPEEVEEHFNRPIFGLIPNDYRRVQSALDLGHPIMANAPSSPARIAIQEMAKRICVEHGTTKEKVKAAPGLFGRIWGKK